MKILNFLFVIAFLICSCEGSDSKSASGSEKRSDLPDEISLSVALPENFEVEEGDIIEISAIGSVVPYHPDIELVYTWSKTTYPESLESLLAKNNGNLQLAVREGEAEIDFFKGQTIVDIAPDVNEGGYVSYSVRIHADGYLQELSNTRGLPSTIAAVNVYIKQVE